MSAVDDAIRLAFDPHVCEYGVDCRRCDQIERGREALRSLVETVSQWREMDSAPKDGTHILVHFPQIGTWQVFWSTEIFDEGSWCVSDNKFEDRPLRGWSKEPTHWMPIPAPPQTREET